MNNETLRRYKVRRDYNGNFAIHELQVVQYPKQLKVIKGNEHVGYRTFIKHGELSETPKAAVDVWLSNACESLLSIERTANQIRQDMKKVSDLLAPA